MVLETLAERFPLRELTVTAAGRDWQITAVTDQGALVDRIKTDADLENFPYGLMLWASAVGLAAKLTQIPEMLHGKPVLEIGAGIGVAGLAAAHVGAAEVILTDFLDDALVLCQHNATINSIRNVCVQKADWRNWPTDLGPFPLIIGSDVLYDRTVHPLLSALLPRLVAPGGTVLLSDPLRPQALDFIEQLERTQQWDITMESAQVFFDGQRKDLAFFLLTRRMTGTDSTG
jgi:predicted nicotinamide N-methyase